MFFVPRKVRFPAMTKFGQARHCSFGLTKTLFFVPRSPRITVSCHINAQVGSALRIWFNESVRVWSAPCCTLFPFCCPQHGIGQLSCQEGHESQALLWPHERGRLVARTSKKKYVVFRSSKGAFSRHDNVRASSTLFIWLNENVLFRSSKSAFSRHDDVLASSTSFIWLNENVRLPFSYFASSITPST